MKRKERAAALIRNNWVFIVFFVGMAVYYLHHMFALKPWYDELYTYYSFISRGPVYSAIHWPVPNNHVLYSVLSAFLDYLGNPYIGLRGISYLAACANLILLYRFAAKFMNAYLAAGCTFLYAAAWQVNYLSVQGRGYTLSITFYLLTLLCLEKICCEKASKWDYIVYACALTGGLYALISSTFWVLPVCLTGGIVLLFTKRYQTMWKLIFASLAAACMTLFLYAVIWLAIGANLMSKDPDNLYYGVYQLSIIAKTPFTALKTGMEYMLATPYIQGQERSIIIAGLFSYLSSVFHLFYANAGTLLTVLGVLTLAAAMIMAVKKRGTDEKNWFFCIYLAVTIIMLPVMLIIQSVHPYHRVFTFLGVPISLSIVWILLLLTGFFKEKRLLFSKVCCVVLLLFCVFYLSKPSYNEQYAQRETEIARMTAPVIEGVDSMFYMDDYQKYVLKFYFDKEPKEVSMEEAQYVLLPKELYAEDYTVPVWPTLYSHQQIDFDCLQENFTLIEESDSYELYERNFSGND